MILKELALNLDKIFHKNLALSWDKAGLQIGRLEAEIGKILITLDMDDDVIEEALNSGSSLIISHHPLIFEPLDAITSSQKNQAKILKLAENRIAVYSAHTSYDIMPGGLIDILAKKLNLLDLKYIKQDNCQWYKFVIFVPRDSQERIRKAICSKGGGKFKNYSCCTFNINGKGTFLPEEGASPYTGKVGNLNFVDEIRMECIVNEENLDELVKAAVAAHPYEEVAYDVYRIENKFEDSGLGRWGKLEEPESFKRYLKTLRQVLQVEDIGWLHKGTRNVGNQLIEKVAVVVGSANSLTAELASLECDLVLVGEISYHNAIQIAENGKIVASLGHGVSEKWAIEDIYKRLVNFFDKENVDVDIIKSKAGYWIWRYRIG